MATIQRVRCVWQNWPGAPGYTNFWFFDTALPPVSSIASFWTAVQGLLPLGLTVTTPSSGDTVDASTGLINGSWSAGTTSVATGTSSQNYAGGAGAVINWLTSTVVNGRRVRGRSFLVPITSPAMDNQGSLSSSTINTLQTAGQALITAGAGGMAVWHRPTAFVGGSAHSITGLRVPDLAASLRSRRV